MSNQNQNRRPRRQPWLIVIVALVAVHGLLVIFGTLHDQLNFGNLRDITDVDIDIPLLIGVGLVYLSTLLKRRKRTAWTVAIAAYTFMIGFYAGQINFAIHHRLVGEVSTRLGVPLLLIILLYVYRANFTVKSDIRSFWFSLRASALVLLIAFCYGTAGFVVMDRHDFHREISIGQAAHHTIDQFGLTTSSPATYTRRARLFEDSLSAVSIAALAYAAISLFQPVRSRFAAHGGDVAEARRLLTSGTGGSEDFFKLWPLDKQYIFDTTHQAGLAYRVSHGVALVVGDPFGRREAAGKLLDTFEDVCYGNDWQPVFVHTEDEWSDLYHRRGYQVQKLGEEAVVDIAQFAAQVRRGKYFRQIENKFRRLDYRTEILQPPHDAALLARLHDISDEWLKRPGRAERGLLMGYFSEAYLQQCTVVVARDKDGVVQAFLNQIPSFDPAEANFDLLRGSDQAPGNCNDFLLLAFIAHLEQHGIARLNLGLCPLAGLDTADKKSAISRTLAFVYSNGDRFYSFSGLKRFKSKYQPEWRSRYVVYRGGIPQFTRAMTVLTRAMREAVKK